MGSSQWSSGAYDNLKASYTSQSTQQIFKSTDVDADMHPKTIVFRESRDSDAHPLSVAIGVFCDVTGSMGMVPEALIRHKLGALMTTLIDHGVADAHVLFGAVGDHYSDRGALQVGQFEAGTEELNLWLTKIWLEGSGGGQNMESYPLAWHFMGKRTSIDCMEKRGEKGFLFTIGDESFHPVMESRFMSEYMGAASEDVRAEDCLKMAQRLYNVFHIHIEETRTGRHLDTQPWRQLLGERFIVCQDYNAVAEIIASTVAIVRGANLQAVLKSFDPAIAQSISTSLMNVSQAVKAPGGQPGVVAL